jgi:hypothetical protein
MSGNLNRNQAAYMIKLGIVGSQGRNQTEIAEKLGIDRVFLNAFLNRRIDLLPGGINRLLDELNLQETITKLSVAAQFTEKATE